jgi:hypothetical protein
MVQHVYKACRIIVESSDNNAQLARLGPQVLNDLQMKVLSPLFRARPDLQSADVAGLSLQTPRTDGSGAQSPGVFRATRRDMDRTTALRLDRALSQIEREIFKVDAENSDQAASKDAAELALQPFMDVIAELHFASKPTYEAYPEIWAKKHADAPQQSRTPESDANFRKQAPPHESVKLSDAALALVKSFMRQLRHDMSQDDQIASIGWARDQRAKGPGDTT